MEHVPRQQRCYTVCSYSNLAAKHQGYHPTSIQNINLSTDPELQRYCNEHVMLWHNYKKEALLRPHRRPAVILFDRLSFYQSSLARYQEGSFLWMKASHVSFFTWDHMLLLSKATSILFSLLLFAFHFARCTKWAVLISWDGTYLGLMCS